MIARRTFVYTAASALLLGVAGCASNTAEQPTAEQSGSYAAEDATPTPEQPEEEPMEERTMIVRDEVGHEVRYTLNDSQAAAGLWNQLPLTCAVEDFSTNEKTFYPEELDVTGAPLAEGGAGTLAYYAPWGDVVMFYDSFSASNSLYELGEAVEGIELISQLSGQITVERA